MSDPDKTDMPQAETLLEFPSRFPIKVMGLQHESFQPVVVQLVRQHAPDFSEVDIEVRASTSGKYVSLTLTVLATSKPQLDDIYRALTGHELVKYVL